MKTMPALRRILHLALAIFRATALPTSLAMPRRKRSG
jgi:hypothetical protein